MVLLNITKEGGLIRELRFNSKPTFNGEQFFASHAHSQRVHLAAAGPLTTAFYTTERGGGGGGVTVDNSIVYDFYFLATM